MDFNLNRSILIPIYLN